MDSVGGIEENGGENGEGVRGCIGGRGKERRGGDEKGLEGYGGSIGVVREG